MAASVGAQPPAGVPGTRAGTAPGSTGGSAWWRGRCGRHQERQDALIEVLHAAQNAYGYLTPELLWRVARRLRLPPSKVYGVATFYNVFTLKPAGAHTLVVCQGTACYIRAPGLAAAVRRVRRRLRRDDPRTGSLGADRALPGGLQPGPGAVLDGAVLSRLTPETPCAVGAAVTPEAPAPATAQEGRDDRSGGESAPRRRGGAPRRRLHRRRVPSSGAQAVREALEGRWQRTPGCG